MVRQLVAGLEHSEEREVVYGLVLAMHLAVDGVVLERLGGEVFAAGPLKGVCRPEVTLPVADPIWVSCQSVSLTVG